MKRREWLARLFAGVGLSAIVPRGLTAESRRGDALPSGKPWRIIHYGPADLLRYPARKSCHLEHLLLEALTARPRAKSSDHVMAVNRLGLQHYLRHVVGDREYALGHETNTDMWVWNKS